MNKQDIIYAMENEGQGMLMYGEWLALNYSDTITRQDQVKVSNTLESTIIQFEDLTDEVDGCGLAVFLTHFIVKVFMRIPPDKHSEFAEYLALNAVMTKAFLPRVANRSEPEKEKEKEKEKEPEKEKEKEKEKHLFYSRGSKII